MVSLGHWLALSLSVVASASAVAASAVAATADGVARAVAADGASASEGGMCLLQDSRSAQLRSLRAAGRRMDAGDATKGVACDESGAFAEALGAPPFYWNNKNGDVFASGSSRFATRANITAGPNWSFKDETKSIVYAHPVVDAEKSIYLMHRNGKLRKFSPQGELIWTSADFFAGKDVINASSKKVVLVGAPVLLNGLLYVADNVGYILAVDSATGALRWRKPAGAGSSMDAWSVAGTAGTVVVAMESKEMKASPSDVKLGGQDEIVAVDAKDGSVLWRFRLPGKQRIYNALFSFALDPPSVLFSESHGTAYRVNLCDGRPIWNATALQQGETVDFSTGGLAQGPDGIAYVTSNFKDARGVKHGRLAAYKIATGELVWEKPVDLPANNAPSVGRLNGVGGPVSVVVGLGENAFFPVPFLDDLGIGIDGRPLGWKTEVAAFSAVTGEPTGWRYAPPPWRKVESEGDYSPGHVCLPDAWSNPAIDSDGSVYLGHMSGKLFALRDINGDGLLDEASGEVQSYYGGRCYQGSPAIADGLLVATPCDGMHVFAEKPSSQ